MSLCLADGSRNRHQRRALSSHGARKASPFSTLPQRRTFLSRILPFATFTDQFQLYYVTYKDVAASARTDDVDAGHEPRRYSTRWDSGWTVSYCCRWRVLPQRRPRSSRSCHRRAPSLRRTWRLRYLNPSRCRFPPSSEPERHWHRHPSVTVRHWVNGIE